MFIFPKFLPFRLFWANLFSTSKVLQINWNLAQGYIPIFLFRFWLLFFRNFCHSYFLGKCSPKIWSSPNKLKFDTGVYCYMHIRILMFSFTKSCHLYSFGNFGQNLMFSMLIEIWYKGILYCWLWFWCVIFWSIWESIFEENIILKSVVLHIEWNLA